MKYVFAMAVIIMLIDLEEKVSKIYKNIKFNSEINNKKENNIKLNEFQNKEVYIDLNEFQNKKVYINLNEDSEINLNSEFLYNQIKGEIIEFDDEWIVFKFHNKNKKKNMCQYIKLIDIESIDIVSND